jgi:hypothetical protein
MAVRSNLHSIGADLGQDIEISARPPDQVRVLARNVTSEVRDSMARLLANQPGVQLEFESGDSHRTPAAGITRRIPEAGASTRTVDGRLATFFGSTEAQEQYTATALEASNRLLTRLHALRELAQRWPADQERLLAPTAKSQLRDMVADHALNVINITIEVGNHFDPLLKHFGYAVSRATPESSGATWQQAIPSALAAAQHTDQLIRSLLTISDRPLSPDDAFPKLGQNLRELQHAVRNLRAK